MCSIALPDPSIILAVPSADECTSELMRFTWTFSHLMLLCGSTFFSAAHSVLDILLHFLLDMTTFRDEFTRVIVINMRKTIGRIKQWRFLLIFGL